MVPPQPGARRGRGNESVDGKNNSLELLAPMRAIRDLCPLRLGVLSPLFSQIALKSRFKPY
jgi:hypothetical protein